MFAAMIRKEILQIAEGSSRMKYCLYYFGILSCFLSTDGFRLMSGRHMNDFRGEHSFANLHMSTLEMPIARFAKPVNPVSQLMFPSIPVDIQFAKVSRKGNNNNNNNNKGSGSSSSGSSSVGSSQGRQSIEPLIEVTLEGVNYRYLQKPPSSRAEFGAKLTPTNRKYSEMGLSLRSKYTKMRMLSTEEEKTAGKFSYLAKKLEKVRDSLQVHLGREASMAEWASACKLSENELNRYMEVSNQARNRLVQHNIRLVDHWARRLIEHSKGGKEVSYYELVTEGVIGLTKAAENYDGASARFAKYAEPFVRRGLYVGMSRLRPGSFVAHRVLMLYYRSLKAQYRLRGNLQRVPTDAEIAAEVGISVKMLHSVREQAKKKVISAETNVGTNTPDSGDIPVTYLDLFLKAGQEGDFSKIDKFMWQMELQQALSEVLTPTERRSVCLRYGLLDGTPRSTDTTAQLMCVSDEAIRKTLLKAMEKIRQSPYSSLLAAGIPEAPITTTNGKVGAIAY